MTRIEATMDGIVDALSQGGRVSSADIRSAVRARGGRTYMLPQATKRLRDMGFPIVVDLARQNTTWIYHPQGHEQDAQHRRMLRDAYSAQMTLWRAFTGAEASSPGTMDPSVIRSVEGSVISLGLARGLSVIDIAADMQVASNTTVHAYP